MTTTLNAMTTTENINGVEVNIEGEYGYGYVVTLYKNNGEHPNGPYFEEKEYEVGTFSTIDEARDEARMTIG